MQSIRFVLWVALVAVAASCGPSSKPPNDDAGPPETPDAAPPDAAPTPDAAPATGMKVRSGTVAGGVKAQSEHYKLISVTKEGGGAPSSSKYQLRKTVHAESKP